MVGDKPAITLWVVLGFIAVTCGAADQYVEHPEEGQGEPLEPIDYVTLGEPHQHILDDIDDKITHIKNKIGKLYSRNSALLHKMNKLDDYIKRGADMETRYVVEIIGYPFNQRAVPPEEFLEHLAHSMDLNFTQSQITGIRILSGPGYVNARLAVEFKVGKRKKEWLKAYKRKLYEISWGDPDKVFRSKEKYKFIQHKTVYLQDFLPTLCEIHAVRAVPFAINDYISPYRKRLLSYAKLLASHYQYRFVWVSEGDIFVRKKDKDPGFYIRSEKDFRLMDWRLENEEFFWKILNECNAKRRVLLRGTTKRVLPWMTTPAEPFIKERKYKQTLINYKRKYDDDMKILLSNVHLHKYFGKQGDSHNATDNYQFLDMNWLNRTRNTPFVRKFL